MDNKGDNNNLGNDAMYDKNCSDSNNNPNNNIDNSSSNNQNHDNLDNSLMNGEGLNSCNNKVISNSNNRNLDYNSNQSYNNFNNNMYYGNNNRNQYENFNSQEQKEDKRVYNLSLASLILGIVSLTLSLSCCCTFISIPFSVVGLVLGLIAKDQNGKRSKFAIAGIVCSVIAIALFILLTILTVLGYFNSNDFTRNYNPRNYDF